MYFTVPGGRLAQFGTRAGKVNAGMQSFICCFMLTLLSASQFFCVNNHLLSVCVTFSHENIGPTKVNPN